MKKLIKRLKIFTIDVHIYQMLNFKEFSLINKPKIEISIIDKRICYFVKDKNMIIHKSFVFPNVYLLNAIKRKGYVIGNCYTAKSHRGLSLFLFVINQIAKNIGRNKGKDVYVIVNSDNISSIKGIEKAGFSKIYTLKAKRWLWF